MSSPAAGDGAPCPLWELGAAELAGRVRAGRTTARAVTEACLERSESLEPLLGAYVELDREDALARADALDRRLDRIRHRTGTGRGTDGDTLRAALPLAGVPVALKDNLSVAGRPLSCGSRILDGYVAPYTATAVERLQEAGAIPFGRTNLDELAMGSSCETSAFGPTRNPWNPERVPGGSSGGSAAAVASSGVPLALGSDTGGSVRQPAALCGVVGLRPTRGRVSRWGLVAFASSLDQVGPLARTVRDAALALAAMAGPDPRDATCSDRATDDLLAALDDLDELDDPERPRGTTGVLDGLRIGTVPGLADFAAPADPADPDGSGLPAAVAADHRAAVDRLAAAGAEVVQVELPGIERSLAAYTVLAAAEASSNLARFDGVRYGRRAAAPDLAGTVAGSRSEGFGPEVRRRILLGTFALSQGYAEQYYGRARAVRQALARQVDRAFERVDVLVTPTAPSGAFPLGSKLDDPVTMYRSDHFTALPSLCGLPSISVPSGCDDDGLPLGLQIVAPRFGERRLLRVAHVFERTTELARPVLDGAPQGAR